MTTANSAFWEVLDSGPGDYAFNMALDEALLEATSRLGRPILRFYGWTSPAASFGYFQKFNEVERLTSCRPLVRRPTGGGIVPHDADWTYSLVFPTTHEWYALAATESYRRVHEWLKAAFAALGLRAELAPQPSIDGPGQCFVGYEKSDLLYRGRKIAGAAQRRRRDGLLIQGSVQAAGSGIARADWQRAVCDVAIGMYAPGWNGLHPDADLGSRAESLVSQKYGQASYNQKR